MKKSLTYIKIFLVAALIMGIQQSCTKLDEKVYSEITGENLFSNPDNLIFAFGVAYTNLYQLFGHKYGGVGIDCGTDLLCVPQRGGDWQDGGEWHRFHRLTWTPTESYVARWWNTIYYGVLTCNQLIFQFESLEDIDATSAIAELRALRALYYYWLIDLYGNVPIETKFDVPPDYRPSTNSREEVFNFIESELLEVMPDLSTETGLSFYGRVNRYVAQTVLAKLYLNAEVYVNTPRYSDAITVCDSIIMTSKFNLAGNYFSSFEDDASASTEVLMGIPFDQVEAPAFEVHLFTLHYNLSGKYQFEDNTWNGICAQESLFNSFEEEDVRRNGLLSGFQYNDDGSAITDPSYEQFNPDDPTYLDPDGAPLNLTPEINMLEPKCLRQAGTRVAKYPFILGSNRYTSNDFAIFRYSEVLMIKAEALLRNGDAGGGLSLVNEVRLRANATPLPELTYENLLAEYAREFYAEGHRRSDMIRFGVYLDARWEKPDVSPDYVTLWPIPESQVLANSNLLQNPGY